MALGRTSAALRKLRLRPVRDKLANMKAKMANLRGAKSARGQAVIGERYWDQQETPKHRPPADTDTSSDAYPVTPPSLFSPNATCVATPETRVPSTTTENTKIAGSADSTVTEVNGGVQDHGHGLDALHRAQVVHGRDWREVERAVVVAAPAPARGLSIKEGCEAGAPASPEITPLPKSTTSPSMLPPIASVRVLCFSSCI